MRAALLALAVVTLTVNGSLAQRTGKKADPPPNIPPKIMAELKPIADKVKATAGEVYEKRPNQFVKQREVASKVRTVAETSPVADKPYYARIHWISNRQETKAYSDKIKADKSEEWLAAGNNNAFTLDCNAYFFYVDGKWVLEKITWGADIEGVRLPRGIEKGAVLSMSSPKEQPKSAWWAVLGEHSQSQLTTGDKTAK